MRQTGSKAQVEDAHTNRIVGLKVVNEIREYFGWALGLDMDKIELGIKIALSLTTATFVGNVDSVELHGDSKRLVIHSQQRGQKVMRGDSELVILPTYHVSQIIPPNSLFQNVLTSRLVVSWVKTKLIKRCLRRM